MPPPCLPAFVFSVPDHQFSSYILTLRDVIVVTVQTFIDSAIFIPTEIPLHSLQFTCLVGLNPQNFQDRLTLPPIIDKELVPWIGRPRLEKIKKGFLMSGPSFCFRFVPLSGSSCTTTESFLSLSILDYASKFNCDNFEACKAGTT